MKTKRILSIVLTLAMLLGMFPGMSLTASAADTTTTITSPATTGTMTITLTIAEATHSVTITAGENMTTTGNASQTGLSGAMTDVVYTAADGYYFPENYVASCTVTANSGVSVTRGSYTQITVSGTPTADATITLANATAKENQNPPETTGLTVTNATNATSADGVISGVTTAMEYSLDNGASWTAVTGTSITGLNPGDVQIRLKGDDTHNASEAVTVAVGDAALISAKTTATETVNAVSADDYIAADQETVANAKTTALAAIENATTTAAVETALTNFNTAISGCTTQAAADLATAKTTATETVNAVSADDYIAADQETVANAKTTALAAIENATTTAAVETALTNFNTAISGCTTQAAADLATAKTNATAEVNAVSADDYIAADQETVANAKTTALAAIENATTEDEVTAAMTTFNNAIAACTTLAAQDLADAKTTATETVNGVNANDYITADQDTVTNAKTTALAAINAATTEDEVTAAMTTFNNAIAACTTQAAADQTAANAVSDTINALPAFADVTTANKDAIEAARTAYNALTNDQKVLVSADTLKKLTDAEDKLVIIQVMSEVSAKTGSGMTYTGNPIQLINTPATALPEGYTMKYAVTTENTAPTDDNLYTTSIPTATGAGTYYVWYKAVSDEDHSDSKPACITVTISKPAVAPAPADEEKGEANFKPSAAAPDVKGVEQEAIKTQMEELAKADDTKLKAGQVKEVTVNMETKAVAESDVPKKEASAIKETAEGMIPAKDRESTKCDFLDIAVSKIVIVYDVKNGQKVKNESDSISAGLTNLAQVIDIPVKYDLTGKFNPLIVRYHNGKAEAFRRLYAAPAKDALKDGTYYVEGTGKNAIVHIYTNRFSTYALLTSGTEEYPKLGDSVTVYRLYYGPTMEHFYTTSAYERRVLIDKYGWVDEGIAWKSPKAPTTDEEKKTIKPVYRLFNPFTTDHHYTKDANERKTLIEKYGWKDEGVAFYSNEKGDATVYRLWHPGLITGAHHFTTGKHEYDVLITRGWIGETEAFKVNAAS